MKTDPKYFCGSGTQSKPINQSANQEPEFEGDKAQSQFQFFVRKPLFCLNIKPEDLFEGIWKKSNEDAFAGVMTKFTATRAGGGGRIHTRQPNVRKS
jgi:hypothetical protein